MTDRKERKILLINPCPREIVVDFLPKNLPLALLSVASTLVDSYEVILLDRAVEKNDNRLLQLLKDPGLAVAGISCLSGPMIKDAVYCSKLIKETNPAITVVWGGWHPTKDPDSVLACPHVDYLIQGEGELSFRAFVDAFGDVKAQKQVSGIGFREGNAFRYLPGQTLDINALPSLPIHLINDITPYVIYNWVPGGGICIPWETSRGCPYSCTFCDVTYQFGSNYNCHTPERMIYDIKRLQKQFAIGGIRFYDPNFFLRIDRVKRFSDLLIEERSSFRWAASGTINQFKNISVETLGHFYSAGLRYVEFGIESGDEEIRHQLLNKRFKTDEIYRVLQRFHEAGIQFKFNLIIGIPGETPEQSEKTLRFALDILEKYPNASIGGHLYIYMPFPGTDLQKKAVAMGYKPPVTLEQYADLDYSTSQSNPWLSRQHSSMLEAISTMSYFLSAPSSAIPLAGLKRLFFIAARAFYLFRLKNRLFMKTPDLALLAKVLH